MHVRLSAGCFCSPLILWRVFFHRTANIGTGEDLHLAMYGTSGLTVLPSLRLVLCLPFPPPCMKVPVFPGCQTLKQDRCRIISSGWLYFYGRHTRPGAEGRIRTGDFRDPVIPRSCLLSYLRMKPDPVRQCFFLYKICILCFDEYAVINFDPFAFHAWTLK